MGTTLNKRSYKEIIAEDIEAIKKYFPKHSLEKDHTIEVLEWSVDAFYEGKGILDHAKIQLLQNAYIQGYRKANIIAGISHGDCEEKTAIKEFNNWYENNHKNS